MPQITLPHFLDKRVFVVGINDSRIACHCQNEYLGFEQACDGPTFVVVGPCVSDEILREAVNKYSLRFGVTLEQLQATRDNQAVISRV